MKSKTYKHGIPITVSAVTNFLKKIIADETITLQVEIFTDHGEWAYGATAMVGDDNKSLIVSVNTDLSEGRDVRDLLFHEVGHLKGKDNHHPSQVERELSAQIWAIKRAKQLKMTNRYKYLKWELEKRWTTKYYKWNSCYRKYIMANKLAKERGLI